MPFDVSCQHEPGVARLALRGELDMFSAPVLERELDRAARRRPERIVLDVGSLRFVDVSGLRTILDAARAARRRGQALAVANATPQLVRLFELTAIDQSVELLGRPLAPVG